MKQKIKKEKPDGNQAFQVVEIHYHFNLNIAGLAEAAMIIFRYLPFN